MNNGIIKPTTINEVVVFWQHYIDSDTNKKTISEIYYKMLRVDSSDLWEEGYDFDKGGDRLLAEVYDLLTELAKLWWYRRA